MNFGEMGQFMRLQCGESPDPTDSYIGDVTAALFLNAAVLYVGSALSAKRTYFDTATVAYNDPSLAPTDPRREGRYSLPLSIVAVKGVHITVGNERRQIEWMDFDDFEQRYGITTFAGQPEAWRTEFGATDQTSGQPGDLWLGPLPNAVFPLRLSVFALPTPIAPTDYGKVYELPREFHPCVCYRAAMEFSLRNDDTSRANKLASLYKESFEQAKVVIGQRNRTGSMSTVKRFVRSKSWTRRAR